MRYTFRHTLSLCAALGAGLLLPAAARAARVTTAGKVVAMAADTLSLNTGAKFRLVPGTTKVVVSGTEVDTARWPDAFAKGDAVVVVYDGKETAFSVRSLAAVCLMDGDYEVMGSTTYVQDGKSIPLVWLRSPANKERYLAEVDAATTLAGPDIPANAAGPAILREKLQAGMAVRITVAARTPTVSQYGDANDPTVVNGVLKSVEIVKGK